MNTNTVIQIIILAALICTSAYFSSAETALTTVNRIHMRTLAEQGNRKAEQVIRITNDSGKMLSAILIGNNVANISSSALTTSLTIHLFGSVGVGIATGILTVLILIFAEITPKTMATIRAEKISLRFCGSILVIMKILTPVIFIINHLAIYVIKAMGVNPSEKHKAMTESELRTIMDIGHESGLIETEEKELLNNIFDFGATEAKEIMVPRIDMAVIQADSSYGSLMEIFRENKHTRIPVYENGTDDVIGILNIKDVLLSSSPAEDFSIRTIMRESYFTHERKNIAELFLEMRVSSISIAIVLDEYGATSGLVTLEDMLEEIVGEIHDEYDIDKEEPLQQISETEFLVEASMNLTDFGDSIGLHLESDDYDSVGGYMIGLLDHLPKIRESVTTPDHVFLQVRTKTKHRIGKIYVRLPDK